MAATLTAPETDEMVRFSFPIEKRADTATVNPVDGTPDIEIAGKATDGTLDGDLQVVDPAWSLSAIKSWYDTGANVRMAHDPKRPVGKGLEVDGHVVRAVIGDPTAKHLIRIGALNDFSIGIMHPDIRVGDPRFKHLDPEGKAVRGVITGRPDGMTQIGEISVVDRGSNYGTRFQLIKAAADGSAEFTGKMIGSPGDIARISDPEVAKSADVITGTVAFSPADLAKLLRHREIAEERVAGLAKASDGGDEAGGDNAAADERDENDQPDMDDDNPTSHDDESKALDADVVKAETAVYKRDVSADERRELAGKGHALKDGSYPIANAEDLHNAAVLARSGHGNAEAAKRLIAKRAAELGVANPLDSDSSGKAVEVQPGDSVTVVPAADKAMKAKMPCPGCGKKVKASAAFCPGCGKKMPPASADKSASPGDGVLAEHTEPVSPHREPDGVAMELLEDDAGLEGSNPDQHSEMAAEARVAPPAAEAAQTGKSVAPGVAEVIAKTGASWTDGVLHDWLCPAFSPDDTKAAYPGYALADVVDLDGWQAKALDAAVSAPLDEAGRAQVRWQAAATLKATSPEDIESLRWEAHKAFGDANPGPSSAPTPGELRPQQFRRPILAGDQYQAPSDGNGTSPMTITAEHISATDYQRGPLGGDQSPPASDGGASNDSQAVPSTPGRPQRTFYRNTSRDGARSAMSSMHDHIAQTFPDLCSMHGPGMGGQPPTGARPVPVPSTRKDAEPDEAKAAGGMSSGKMACPECKKKVKKGKPFCGNCGHKMTGNTAEKETEPEVAKAAAGPAPVAGIEELVKVAVTDATASLVKQLREQGELIDQMAAAPDPRYAPFKAVAAGGVLPKMADVAADPERSNVEKAARGVQDTLLAELQHQARNSPDPNARETAWRALSELLNLPGTATAARL